MEKIHLERCCNLIAMRTGIIIRVDERGSLRDYILTKLRSSSITSLESYFSVLESDSSESRQEWRDLINGITIGESYFFRDKGQFGLLENRILPELIELRKKERTLRIWSAGCSTGEEAYSLAILVSKLIPAPSDWKIFILGTDINEEFVKKAGTGLYGQWSFRRVESEIKERFFKKRRDQWEIDGRIRDMVIFRTMNLVEDQISGHYAELYNMDLILCRNLFIYFNRNAVAKVLKKLVSVLATDGYLMTGHGELHNQELAPLTPLIFSESVIYRKSGINTGNTGQAVRMTVTMPENQLSCIQGKNHFSFNAEKNVSVIPDYHRPAVMIDENILVEDMKSLFKSGDYSGVIQKAGAVLNINPGNTDASFFMARAYAGKGLYDDALKQLRYLLGYNPVNTGAYLLLAQISEIMGDHEGAKDSLKKVIYLDPGSVEAHLELGSIYQKEKDPARSSKMRTTAMKLIKALPSETIFEIYDGISASELGKYVAKMLEDE